MPDTNLTLWSAISGGIGGLVIAALSALGLKGRVDNVDKTKVEKDAFKEFKDAQKTEHQRIEKGIDKLFDKVNQMHKDMPKRNGDT